MRFLLLLFFVDLPILSVCHYNSSPVNSGDPELISWLKEHGADEDTVDKVRKIFKSLVYEVHYTSVLKDDNKGKSGGRGHAFLN